MKFVRWARPVSTNPISRQPAAVRTVLQNRYQLERKLGAGGMSTVYLARDLRFGETERHCAVKEMVNAATDSETRRLNLDNFTREANLLASITHPAIPKVYDFFSQDSKSFLVLEFIDGVDLEQYWARTREPQPPGDVVNWCLQVADVLAFLHEHEPPVIFRDVKPSNIMLTRLNQIVLIDFGIARLFQSGVRGTMIGTEGYAPPEQYRGVAEPRGDIYALGATMHHLLSGRDPRLEPPFTFVERPLKSANAAVSTQLEAVVMKALAYEPDDRPPSAREFARLLRAASGAGGDAPAAGASSSYAPGATRSAAVSGASDAKPVWKFACEDEIRSSPRIEGGVLYIGCYDHNLYALDAATGKFIWKYPTEAGISSTPLPTADAIYLGSEDQTLYALHPANGQVLWRMRTKGPIRSSPRLAGDAVIIGSDDGAVYAVSTKQQTLLWRFQAMASVRSSALVVGETVYIGCDDGNLYALQTRDGRQRWKYNAGRFVISSPAHADGLVFFGAGDQAVHAVDGRSGWSIWRVRTEGAVVSSPAILDDKVYIGSADGNVYALDTHSGRQQWKATVGGQIASSPAVTADSVYFGSEDGRVHALERRTGRPRWVHRTGGMVMSSPVVSDGRVYIASADHFVYALPA